MFCLYVFYFTVLYFDFNVFSMYKVVTLARLACDSSMRFRQKIVLALKYRAKFSK